MRRDDGPLTLVGLYWLKEGVNTLGSSGDCDIQLPKRAPRLLGAIRLDATGATLHLDLGQSAEVNGVPAETATRLRSKDEPPASIITFNDLRLGIVRDKDRLGLRLWDTLRARELPPRSWFAVDENLRLRAMYTPYPTPSKVGLPNTRGEIETGYVQGYVSFKLGGKSYRLDAAELDDGRLYLPFGDLTNGVKTYPSGRYLNSEPVLEDGQVYVDFNRAYNPPCAYMESEPCTFAPSGNHLKVAIEAGELYQGHK